MSIGGQILLGVGCSFFAAFLVSTLWWLRLRRAAGEYVGKWELWEIHGCSLKKGNGTAEIARAGFLWRPEKLVATAQYESQGRTVHYAATIWIDPIATSRAKVILQRTSDDREFEAQDYYMTNENEIFVVPSDTNSYQRHMLRRAGKFST